MGNTELTMLNMTSIVSPKTAQHSMVFAASLTLLLGATFAFHGQTSQAIMNFGISLFFVFVYCNPDLLLSKLDEMANKDTTIEQKKFLWSSLLLGLFAIFWELSGLTG